MGRRSSEAGRKGRKGKKMRRRSSEAGRKEDREGRREGSNFHKKKLQ